MRWIDRRVDHRPAEPSAIRAPFRLQPVVATRKMTNVFGPVTVIVPLPVPLFAMARRPH